MKNIFPPFTPDVFKKETGLDASDNEAIYFRWLNAHMNYANFQSLNEITRLIREVVKVVQGDSLTAEHKLA